MQLTHVICRVSGFICAMQHTLLGNDLDVLQNEELSSLICMYFNMSTRTMNKLSGFWVMIGFVSTIF